MQLPRPHKLKLIALASPSLGALSFHGSGVRECALDRNAEDICKIRKSTSLSLLSGLQMKNPHMETINLQLIFYCTQADLLNLELGLASRGLKSFLSLLLKVSR